QHTSPQDLALQLCVAMGAHEYLNPPGGAGLYDAEQFAAHGIHLTIQKFVNMPYTCGRFQHEPALSIIDVMMWNSPAEIGCYLNIYRESHMLPKENYATVSPARQ
ncbi:MAG: WbqC family protein, partial [Candidatus Promineifilaceae bacterium]